MWLGGNPYPTHTHFTAQDHIQHAWPIALLYARFARAAAPVLPATRLWIGYATRIGPAGGRCAHARTATTCLPFCLLLLCASVPWFLVLHSCHSLLPADHASVATFLLLCLITLLYLAHAAARGSSTEHTHTARLLAMIPTFRHMRTISTGRRARFAPPPGQHLLLPRNERLFHTRVWAFAATTRVFGLVLCWFAYNVALTSGGFRAGGRGFAAPLLHLLPPPLYRCSRVVTALTSYLWLVIRACETARIALYTASACLTYTAPRCLHAYTPLPPDAFLRAGGAVVLFTWRPFPTTCFTPRRPPPHRMLAFSTPLLYLHYFSHRLIFFAKRVTVRQYRKLPHCVATRRGTRRDRATSRCLLPALLHTSPPSHYLHPPVETAFSLLILP